MHRNIRTLLGLTLLLGGYGHAQQSINIGGATNNAAITTAQQQAAAAQAAAAAALQPSAVGVTVAPLVNGLVPPGNLPPSTGLTAAQQTTLNNALTSSAIGSTVASQAAVAAAQAASLVAQHQAGALSPLDYGVKCDGQVMPIMGLASNGNYLGTAVVAGTDDTAAITAYLNALAVGARKSGNTTIDNVGVTVEGSVAPSYQAVAHFPYAAHCLVSSFPNVPEGVELQLNGSEIDITSATGNGPSFVGLQNSGQYIVNGNTITNGMPGRSNDTMHGGRIVYAGPVGQSTGIGVRADDALDENISDVNAYGFKTCFSFEAVEYSHFDFNQAGYCGIGFLVTSGWTTPGGPSMPGGGISIDNNFFGNVARLNKVNYWLNGAAGNRFYAGTGAFASKANIVFGGAPPDYIDTLALSNVATGSYAANTSYPLTFGDPGGGTAFEGVMLTDGSGTPVAAWSTDGGMNMTTQAIVSAPACTTTGCHAPTVTAHIGTFKGIAPFDATAGAGINSFTGMDLESEGCQDAAGNGIGCSPTAIPAGRPSSGFQIIADASSGGNFIDKFQDNIGGSPQEFTRLARDIGGNTFTYNQVGTLTDPGNPAISCLFMHGTYAHSTVALNDGVNPAKFACYLDGTPDGGSPYMRITGSRDGTQKLPGLELYFGNAAAAPYADLFDIVVDGEAQQRMYLDGNGAIHYGPGGGSIQDVIVGRTGTGIFGLAQGMVGTFPFQSFTNGTYSSGTETIQNAIDPSWLDWRWNGGTGYTNGHHGMRSNASNQPEYFFAACGGSTAVGGETGCVDVLRANATGVVIPTLNGSGNAFVCVNASGQLYRSATACQ